MQPINILGNPTRYYMLPTIACAIQYCLAKRDHKEHLCQAFIDDWKSCCDKVRAASATAAAKDTKGD